MNISAKINTRIVWYKNVIAKYSHCSVDRIFFILAIIFFTTLNCSHSWINLNALGKFFKKFIKSLKFFDVETQVKMDIIYKPNDENKDVIWKYFHLLITLNEKCVNNT